MTERGGKRREIRGKRKRQERCKNCVVGKSSGRRRKSRKRLKAASRNKRGTEKRS